jgi:LemA protein
MAALALMIATVAYVYVDGRAVIVEKQRLIEEAWETAAEVISKRSEQVPPLAMTIRDAGWDEGQLLQDLLEARAGLESLTERPAMIEANRQLSDSLAQVLSIAARNAADERSPDFARRQDQIAETENELAVARRRYNQAVQDYNTSIQLFPSNFVAGLAGFVREEAYFRTTEEARQAAPTLNFSQEAPEPEATVEE